VKEKIPREIILCWKPIYCRQLRREVLMVVVKNPLSSDFRDLLERYRHCHRHGLQARRALRELDEVEMLATANAA
jgi:hypothetical protein